ncbi:MAG: PBP1A family penicillin-binding protein [Parcubacteria group bacterium]|nr:PBP1A family penicillin-binding protein [Parcubacteria group bacterium]
MAKHRRHQKLIDVLVGFVALCFLFAGLLLFWFSTITMPSFDTFDARQVVQSTKIYDRTGEVLLFDLGSNLRRTVVPYGEISRNIKNAAVAIEDAEFYQHNGIKPKAIIRAILVNITKLGFSQGGSTITQQVVKNSLLTTEKKISRKLKEWVLALKLEKIASKEQILGLYLNESPYGGNLYGIEEASLAFFGKKAKDVTLAEAAYLAALPNAPTYYSPYGIHRDKLEERKNFVLDRMLELKFISEDEYKKAREEKVLFAPQEEQSIKAPHFVMFIRSYLEEKYGKEVVNNGGLKVITTLDYELQKTAEDIVSRNALENEKKFNASNAGLVAVEPKTGDILVMVGSRNYFDSAIDGNFNVALSHRQPGSAFKPFVYATAFKKGYSPDTVVFDVETEFQTTCTPEGKPYSPEGDPDACYMPENYDGVFRGPVSLRTALAQSINIPAIKVLYLSGIGDSIRTAQSMGIDISGDANRYGLTLVLGGGEVSLLDITGAYGVFANNGIKNTPRGILHVEDAVGNVLENAEERPERVLDEGVALQISSVLSDNEARAPAFGEQSYLFFPGRDVAAKTGTTNDYRDAWIVGYTTGIAVGAWAGNNDNSPMEKKVAGFIIAPMWNEFMQEVIKKTPNEKFKTPQEIKNENTKPILRGIWKGGETYFVDTISGKLATEYTPKETRDERVIPNIHSILYWIDKNNPLGAPLERPEQDPQFVLWETAVQKWALSNGLLQSSSVVPPTETDDIHTPALSPKITIVSPTQSILYPVGAKISVLLNKQLRFPLSSVDYFINDVYAGSVKKEPFIFSFIPDDIVDIKEINTLRVISTDSVFNKSSATQEFRVVF